MLGEESIPLTLDIVDTYTLDAVPTELRFAAGIAAYGMMLRDSKFKGSATFDMAYQLVGERLSFDKYGYRAQLQELIRMAKNVQQ
jgi:Ca-activated chloride channel family protein